MKPLKLTSTIQHGHFPQDVRNALATAMQKMEGKKLTVTLSVPEDYSSSPQRRYYFAVIVTAYLDAFKVAGNVMDDEDMHLWLKQEVGKLWKNIITPEGEVTKVMRSYRDLSVSECEAYHLQCRARAADLGIDIPEPGEMAA